MYADTDDFCLALKAARERSGLTLDQIAETTKIPASLFAALERNDLRRWPKGLFRRSFFRDYARTIGLPVAEACDAFVRLFPDETTEVTTASGQAEPATRSDEVRLVLDPAWHGPRASIGLRLLAVLIDAGIVIAVGAVLAWASPMDWPATIAIVALVYFSLSTAVAGESLAMWSIPRRRSILDAISNWFRSAESGTPEPLEEPEPRAWVSDARRVGPSRLRVRIKVS